MGCRVIARKRRGYKISTSSYVNCYPLNAGVVSNTFICKIEWHVNVGDIARIHAIALLDPNVQSERLFAFAAPFTWTGVIDILRKLRPSNKSLVNPPEDELPDPK